MLRMKLPWTFVFAVIVFASAFILVPMNYADAQRGRISLIRDAEIEALIQDYTRPLMKVVGLRPGSVQIHIVNDQSFNAFVSGRGMFIHTGLLLHSKTPGEVIGVIAHELGHIVGGHQIRQRE